MQVERLERIKAYMDGASEAVSLLDFSLQKRKMTEVLGWASEVVELMEGEYRKFLSISSALKKSGENINIVPNRLIDEFWHVHIMDTEKYHDDCQHIFSEYFHHYPYFGFVDEEDVESWKSDSDIANQVWQGVFGETMYGVSDGDAYGMDRQFHAEMSATILASQDLSAVRCRTQCKPVKCR